jgi:hypothetical protein
MSVFNVLPSGVNTFFPTFWKHPDDFFKKGLWLAACLHTNQSRSYLNHPVVLLTTNIVMKHTFFRIRIIYFHLIAQYFVLLLHVSATKCSHLQRIQYLKTYAGYYATCHVSLTSCITPLVSFQIM